MKRARTIADPKTAVDRLRPIDPQENERDRDATQQRNAAAPRVASEVRGWHNRETLRSTSPHTTRALKKDRPMTRHFAFALATGLAFTSTAALAAERVGFRSPKEIADEAIACLTTAKTKQGAERRVARNKCLADRRKAMSEFRKAKKQHKVLRAGYKMRVKKGMAACKSAGKKVDAGAVARWKGELAAWTQQMDKYLKTGGERPLATPPELPAELCK